ncbi:hypothetical protein N431DRAFT_25129 [Stipitochalara longipes BDJ]|nr:hypothetical protein N431DRAFT_25129 [Stipitochalara longipes BDJ]
MGLQPQAQAHRHRRSGRGKAGFGAAARTRDMRHGHFVSRKIVRQFHISGLWKTPTFFSLPSPLPLSPSVNTIDRHLGRATCLNSLSLNMAVRLSDTIHIVWPGGSELQPSTPQAARSYLHIARLRPSRPSKHVPFGESKGSCSMQHLRS